MRDSVLPTPMPAPVQPADDGPYRRAVTIGMIGFLTLVDLFATQAILPQLAVRYGVSAGEIGLAVNASTIGMAAAGLGAAALGRRIERRRGIWISLALLAVPTTLLAFAPGLATFAALRIAQGVFMATAFTLTLTYLSERCTKTAAATALAAYVTGNVASNLVGRLVASTVAGAAGLEANFFLFAALNLAGALLAYRALAITPPGHGAPDVPTSLLAAWRGHLTDARLLQAFAVGFLILFGFIGTFTYVGFVLAGPPLSLSMAALGLVFLAFAPSMFTTPLAGSTGSRHGAAAIVPPSLMVAVAGLALLLVARVEAIIAGLVLVAAGTFFAQAVATGYVGRAATRDRAAASGLYLSAYYLGGLVGAALVGQVFDRAGWTSAVAANALALLLAALIGRGLKEPRG